MKTYAIKKHTNDQTLFEGRFTSFKQCLETAVKNNIDLMGANLNNKNLMGANLDDAIMPQATFKNTNLTGANLSESVLTLSYFENTTLHGTCLSFSNLNETAFNYAAFGATDITGARLDNATFKGTSCYSLNFFSCESMHECVFTDNRGRHSQTSKPPTIIYGMQPAPIIMINRQATQHGIAPLMHELNPIHAK